MSTLRLQRLLAPALAVLLLSSAAPAQVTIETDQPAYEVSQQLSVNIYGPPGAQTYLLVDVLPGPVVFPFGTIHIGFSPIWFMVNLGPMPADGSMFLQEAFSCRTAFNYGVEVYLQAICIVNGAKELSNGLHIAEMPGDCTDVCEGGVQEVGLQVTLEGVPQTGDLHVTAFKSNGFQHEYGPLDATLDLAVDATGILATPLIGDNGCAAVSMLEWDGSDLTVRFFIDAPECGHVKLGGNTLFVISFGGVEKSVEFHTSCSQPLYVGQVYGDFTVIKVIDVL
ncbi:MAG TPA: hypothetical protein VFD43_05635 [Planctomycetota bacterium]|nr:hypothetical protein [Planctomycetota bacterium]